MIQISRTGIRNLASNDTVYARGLQYYKENRVVSASYSNMAKLYRLEVKEIIFILLLLRSRRTVPLITAVTAL